MKYDWKIGDLALVTSLDGLPRTGIRVRSRCLFGGRISGAGCSNWGSGDHWHTAENSGSAGGLLTARPLILLDPESDKDVLRYYNSHFDTAALSLGLPAMFRTRRKMTRMLPTPVPEDCGATIEVNGSTYTCELAPHRGKHKVSSASATIDIGWGDD